jgi:hypothetical protein
VKLLLAAALLLAIPASAPAATRHADPDGSSFSCTNELRCPLGQALSAANDGDEVVLHEGTYSVPAPVSSGTDSVSVHGAAGEGRAVLSVTTGAGECGLLVAPDSAISDLDVVLGSSSARGLCPADGTTVQRVRVTGSWPGVIGIHVGNDAEGVVIRDVLVRITGANSEGIRLYRTPDAQLRNATVLMTGSGSEALAVGSGPAPGTLTVRDSVLSGTGGAFTLECPTQPLTLAIDHSAYSAPGGGCTFSPGEGNVPFAGVKIGADGRQDPASNTVDAGIGDAYTGAVDLEGTERPQGGRPDIGAHELQGSVPTPEGSVPSPEMVMEGSVPPPEGSVPSPEMVMPGSVPDRVAPRCRGLRVRRRGRSVVVSGRCDEAATLRIRVGRRSKRVAVPAGAFRTAVRLRARRRRARITATDATGNVAAPVTVRVRRATGG